MARRRQEPFVDHLEHWDGLGEALEAVLTAMTEAQSAARDEVTNCCRCDDLPRLRYVEEPAAEVDA